MSNDLDNKQQEDEKVDQGVEQRPASSLPQWIESSSSDSETIDDSHLSFDLPEDTPDSPEPAAEDSLLVLEARADLSNNSTESADEFSERADSETPLPKPPTRKTVATKAENRNAFALDGSKDSLRLAFVGGRSVGKTYLFQALVKQLMDVENAGALSYFIKDPVRLFRKAVGEDVFSSTNEYDYTQNYENWVRLDPTQIAAQDSYQLRIPIRTGWLGKNIKHMYVEYFDGAGEHLTGRYESTVTTWFNNYADAEVMVFCLPFWAAFPTSEYDGSPPMSEGYKDELQETIKSFDTIVKNYADMREKKGIKTKVKCVVALTQADQIKHTTLGQELADSWLLPFKLELEREEHELNDQVDEYNKQFSKGKGVNLYLENARNLSDILRQKIKRNKAINSSLSHLSFGSGEPWLIPMSAISGHDLDRVAQGGTSPMHSPIPAHVELPLLVALSQYCNALM